jgi:Aerotolerance regulator N-terminal
MDLFLNPAYMVAGAALISAPIIIHLINRMRYKRIRWAAMEFLLKSQKRNRRRLIIEQLILLALRCLLIALAGFLLARYIGKVTTAGETDVDHFVVLDDSLSMKDRWKDETGKDTTSFDVGKQKVLEIAKESLKANSKQYLHLVLLSNLDNEVKINDDGRLNQESVRTLESKLNDLSPSRLHVKPIEGVKWARAKQTAPNNQRMLHFVSDLRESDWSGPEYKNLTDELDGFTNSGGKVLLFDVAYKFRTERQAVALHQENIGISDMQPETRFTAEGLPVQFTLTIKNYTAAAKNVFLNVKVDGQVRFEAAQPIELKPGDNKHTFLLSFNKTGPNMISAALVEKGDADSGIPDDNIRVAVIQVKPQVPVLIIDGSVEKAGGARRDSYYLQKLFTDAAKGYQIVNKTREELENLELTTERYPCLYLLDVPELSDKALKKLETYVEQGGRVAIFVGDNVQTRFYNDKLFAKGQGIFPVPLEEKHPERIDADTKFKRLFEDQYQIFFRDDSHQIFKDVADPKVKEVFKFLSIEEYWPAQNRLQWKDDPAKVHELVTLPNRGTADTYSVTIKEIREKLGSVVQDDKFEKFRPALERYQKRIDAAIGEGTLYPLATALDLLLSERGDPRNLKQSPDLKEFWEATENEPLRSKITSLRDAAMYGDPLVVTKSYGKGETIAFLTTAGKNWNDWAGGGMASPTYPVVMLNLQKYLTSSSNETSRNVGAPLEIALDADSYEARGDLSFQAAPQALREGDKEDNSDAAVRKLETTVGKEDDMKLLHFSFPRPREPGVYFVAIKGKPKAGDLKEPQPFEEAFVYNVDTENEGNLKRASKDQLEHGSASAQPGAGKVSLIAYDTRLNDILAPRRKDMSEAPWLYLLILVVLIIEQALAVHLSFHLKGNEAQLPPGVAGEGRTPVPSSEAA